MVRNIKLIVEYDGAAFHGWQVQKGQRTVQGELQRAIAKVVQHNVRVCGSGRTDAGVHAVGQAANFHTKSALLPDRLLKGINAHLPLQIAVQSAEDVAAEFHARYDAKWKTYRYVICNSTVRRPLLWNLA